MKKESLNQRLEKVRSLLEFYLLLWNVKDDAKLFDVSVNVLKKALRKANSKEWYQEFMLLCNLKYYKGISELIAKSANEQAETFVALCHEAAEKGGYDNLLLHDAYSKVLSCLRERLISAPEGLQEAIQKVFVND